MKTIKDVMFSDKVEAEQGAADMEKKDPMNEYLSYESCGKHFVKKMPSLGDRVSMDVNGKSVQCGTIIRISGFYDRITTDEDYIFDKLSDFVWVTEDNKKLIA